LDPSTLTPIAWLIAEFAEVTRAYRRHHPEVALMLVDEHGAPVGPVEPFPCSKCGAGVADWRQMVEEVKARKDVRPE